ncbi:MAG: alpha/beta fold hydrolase, partial [Gemmataceae bacterium]
MKFLLGLLFLLWTDMPAESVQVKKARDILDSLVKKEYGQVVSHFGPRLKDKLPKEKLEEVWVGVNKRLGAMTKVVSAKQSKIGDNQVVDLTCQFEKLTLDLRFSLNQEGKLEGFFIRPSDVPKFESPPYANKDKFREEAISIGKNSEWPLPASITLPMGMGPFPGVVLVHGSGPQDRDETYGPNKPFRDLAWGLASRGVAVLRYEKRTREHARKLGDGEKITLKEEVIDDALAALQMFREHPLIQPGKVFLLGHSLGAMTGPRIALKDGYLGGLILLAGNSRPLEELIAEQFTYLSELEPPTSDKEKENLAEVLKKVDRIRKGDYQLSTSRMD